MLSHQHNEVHFRNIKAVLHALFEPRPNTVMHLELSPLNHGYGHAQAGDRPTSLARSALKLESRREMRTSEAN